MRLRPSDDVGPARNARLPLPVVPGTTTQVAGADLPNGSEPVAPRRRRIQPLEAVAGLAVVAAVAGVVLRFVTSSPLWLDEALTVNIAKLPLGEIGSALKRDGHPPLYYWLLHGWIRLVGSGDTAVRVMSGLFSLATLPLAWVAGKRLAARPGAWVAVAVFALSPYALRYSNEARMYSLVMLLALAGYLLVGDALERPTLVRLGGIAVITGLGLLSHYWWIYFGVGAGLILLWRARRPDDRPAAVRVLGAMAIGSLAFVPWLPNFLYQAAHTGTPWAKSVRPSTVLTITMNDIGGIGAEGQLVGLLITVLVLVALFARPLDGHRMELDLRTRPGAREVLVLAGLTLGAGMAVAYASGGTYETRYGAVFIPFLLLAAVVGVTRLAGGWVRVGVVALLVAGGLLGGYRNSTTDRTQLDLIAHTIDAQAKPGDVVVFCPDQLGPAGSRHLRADVDAEVFPTGAGPTRVDWVDYAKRNQAADAGAFARGVLDRARPGATIWLAWASTYKTFEGKCETIATTLQVARPAGTPVVTDNGQRFFEHAWLMRYPAA